MKTAMMRSERAVGKTRGWRIEDGGWCEAVSVARGKLWTVGYEQLRSSKSLRSTRWGNGT